MSNWFHTVAGRYDIANKWIGLDFGQLLSDPKIGDGVLAHEMAHTAMAQETEFGQASQATFYLLDTFKHLTDEQKNELAQLVVGSQDFVQEGLATLFQIAHLGNITSKKFASDWAKQNLPDEYLKRLDKLRFVLDFSPRYRDFFTQKISHLALQTEIRKDTAKLDLLSDPAKLKDYLSDPNKNPNERLEKLIETLKYKNWLVTKPIPEIAKECGISYFDSLTKEEVAGFLTYATGLTDNPKTFTVDEIGDTPQDATTFIEAGKHIIVGNMNLNFAQNGQALFDLRDFIHYADKMEIMFVNPNTETKYKEVIKFIGGHDPEVNIAGVLKTGEKYLTSTSKEKAAELLNNELKEVTMMVKWGGYNLLTNQLIWSETVRPPNLVVYNTPEQMLAYLKSLIQNQPNVKFSHLHLGATEGHPMQTLLVKVEGLSPVHSVNTWGNRGIVEVLKEIKERSRLITNEELKSHKKHLNNLFAFWMNMHWDIDWVETMIDGSTLIFRKQS